MRHAPGARLLCACSPNTSAFELRLRLSAALVCAVRYQVFCNPIGLGIDTAKSEPASQTLQLDAEQLAAGCKLDLRFVLFQKVSSLAFFFPENHEGACALRNSPALSP